MCDAMSYLEQDWDFKKPRMDYTVVLGYERTCFVAKTNVPTFHQLPQPDIV